MGGVTSVGASALIIKDVLSVSDAHTAIDPGADSVIVSNHGGVGNSMVP